MRPDGDDTTYYGLLDHLRRETLLMHELVRELQLADSGDPRNLAAMFSAVSSTAARIWGEIEALQPVLWVDPRTGEAVEIPAPERDRPDTLVN